MSGDDQGDGDLDLDLDFFAENLKLADGGDREAIRDLLMKAAGQLGVGQIADGRLRFWLVEYLSKLIDEMPGSVGSPTKGEDHIDWALRVERLRRKLIAGGRKERGAQAEAIRQLAEQVSERKGTVKAAYYEYREWAEKEADRLEQRDAVYIEFNEDRRLALMVERQRRRLIANGCKKKTARTEAESAIAFETERPIVFVRKVYKEKKDWAEKEADQLEQRGLGYIEFPGEPLKSRKK